MAMAYGGIYCFSNNSHIKVVLMRDMLPLKWQKRFAILVDVLTLIFSIGGAYAMYYMVSRSVINPMGEFYMQRSGSAMNSVWPTLTKIFILLVFIILIVQAFLHLLKKIKTYRVEEE
jgi:TRAP-type C4-dicarboxylate transport system permease small subunit